MREAAEAKPFDRCGGHVALDFANAMNGRRSEEPVDLLPTYAALIAFARQCELASPAQLRRLERRAALDPAGAEAVRRQAGELREAIYALFSAAAENRSAGAAELAVFNRAVARLRIGADFGWEWAAGPDALDSVLAPIVRSALDLLLASERDRVRICDAGDCGWLFLDTSKNRSRRWCDMKQCGNRNKARRFYERQR